MSDPTSPGRRKSRISMMQGAASQRSMRAGSSRSFATNAGSDYPEGRAPRASFAQQSPVRAPRASFAQQSPGRSPRASISKQGDFPPGRQPRASFREADPPSSQRVSRTSVIKRAEVVKEEIVSEADDEEREAKRRRKRLAVLIACCLACIIIIIVVIILLSVVGTSDAPPVIPDAGIPAGCTVDNTTKPATYDDFMCDLMTTLTDKNSSTFLRTYPTSSPYGMTIIWMTGTDRTDYNNLPRENALERFVMTLFYFSTGGRDWYTKFEFLTQAHVCDWTGDSVNAIRCAFSDRKVTDLGIPQNGMNGQIPTEMGYLTGLTRLYFSLNQLTGTIPSEIGLLTNLRKLYLDRNNMRGQIPEEINNLNLTTLYLNNNDFNGDLTGLCDTASSTELEFDYHADCDTGRVGCPCCATCV